MSTATTTPTTDTTTTSGMSTVNQCSTVRLYSNFNEAIRTPSRVPIGDPDSTYLK